MDNLSLTPTEKAVSTVWRALLKSENIRPEDNYFELGGDSLMMIDMLAQVGTVLNVEIDPGALFEDSSLRGFARIVDERRQADRQAKEMQI